MAVFCLCNVVVRDRLKMLQASGLMLSNDEQQLLLWPRHYILCVYVKCILCYGGESEDLFGITYYVVCKSHCY